jgi:hypothetical protein
MTAASMKGRIVTTVKGDGACTRIAANDKGLEALKVSRGSNPEYVNLASEARTKHILLGEASDKGYHGGICIQAFQEKAFSLQIGAEIKL